MVLQLGRCDALVSFGHDGREALKGEYESTTAIHAISPGLCPQPIAWGTFQNDDSAHFYVCKFYGFDLDALPPRELFCKKLVLLHSRHTSPEGKFGSHCVTYNGNILQDNAWCGSWEVFFSRGLRHVLNVREERAGPDPELNALIPGIFDKVIPRLLWPLESGGRKVHGDLWCGNARVDRTTGESAIYEPSSFWAHNECKSLACLLSNITGALTLAILDELGNWRPSRNKLQSYINEYHVYMPMLEPRKDYNDRNRLYGMKFNVHASAMF
ncbi:hypothetical protein RB594_001562 [Gaeumannomyces avenae]